MAGLTLMHSFLGGGILHHGWRKKLERQEISKLKESDSIVSCFYRALKSGENNLRNAPGLLLRLINENMWQKRMTKTGEIVEFTKFVDFITSKPLAGLGEDMESIKRICRDDPQALDAIDRVTVNPKHIHISDSDNVTITKQVERGNTNQYALRRLRKSRPDLHELVLQKKLSPHAAMIQAGFRKKTFVVRKDVDSLIKFIKKNFDREQRNEIAVRLFESAKSGTSY
jgi:hypothetical protein